MRKKRRRLKKSVKRGLIIISSLILIITTVSYTIAFLSKNNNLDNEFILGTVSTSIEETFENNVKKNVSIKNNGNVNSYIRVAIITSFKDSNSIILPDIPEENTDYSIDFSQSPNWLYSDNDGFYYYKLPVEPNTNTDILINECKTLKEYEDKTFNIDIITQSIQAEPSRSVIEAWDVNITDNTLSLKS